MGRSKVFSGLVLKNEYDIEIVSIELAKDTPWDTIVQITERIALCGTWRVGGKVANISVALFECCMKPAQALQLIQGMPTDYIQLERNKFIIPVWKRHPPA